MHALRFPGQYRAGITGESRQRSRQSRWLFPGRLHLRRPPRCRAGGPSPKAGGGGMGAIGHLDDDPSYDRPRPLSPGLRLWPSPNLQVELCKFQLARGGRCSRPNTVMPVTVAAAAMSGRGQDERPRSTHSVLRSTVLLVIRL